MKRKTNLRFENLPKDYGSLCRKFLPRPIHDAVEYLNTAEVADAMALWQDEFTPDQSDYFEMLCSLLEAYDSENVEWPEVSGVDLLKHLMTEHEMKSVDLSHVLGASRNVGSMILSGKRGLSKANIRKVADYFKVSPELFL